MVFFVVYGCGFCYAYLHELEFFNNQARHRFESMAYSLVSPANTPSNVGIQPASSRSLDDFGKDTAARRHSAKAEEIIPRGLP